MPIHLEQNESRAVKMMMVYDDGSTVELDKGFIIGVNEIQPGDTQQTVSMMGCNMSGQELIKMAVTVLAPIVNAAYPDSDDFEDDDE